MGNLRVTSDNYYSYVSNCEDSGVTEKVTNLICL